MITNPGASAHTAEVSGRAILSVVTGMGSLTKRVHRVLSDNGIPDPQPETWYPHRAWLTAFSTMAEYLGPNTLNWIGERFVETAEWPLEINSIEKALSSIDLVHQLQHRGGDVGHYAFEKTGENSGKVICSAPNPCDFDRGLVFAIAKRFKPNPAVYVRVAHDLNGCRQLGADTCTYHVHW